MVVQIGGDGGEGLRAGGAGGFDVAGDGAGIGDGLAVMLGGDARAVEAELDAPGLGGGEGCPGALGDHLALVLGEGGHDVQDQARGVQHTTTRKARSRA